MSNNADEIKQLYARLDALLKQHDSFRQDIESLRTSIDKLQSFPDQPVMEKMQPLKMPPPPPPPPPPIEEQPQEQERYIPPTSKPRSKSELEKFIGENLINKIGVLIIFIGVVIGVKYAIEHQLVSLLTRIVLSYLVGAGLLGFAIKLKEKYEGLSATLVSGAIGILYFVTFAAYDFYSLIPQAAAFTLMLVFTAFTIVAAIQYNRQVIAHIGLVGAYAIPFLLSSGSGRVDILFSYMAIINVGIMILAFRKYWSALFYAAFAFTWLIYGSWLLSDYDYNKHFTIAIGFGVLFFIVNYIMVLAYKLYRKEIMGAVNTSIMLANAFIFYGLGYFILEETRNLSFYNGLFTVANALVHFTVSTVIYSRGVADRNLFYLVVGLVLVFITIAVPVQLDGNWVTLLWAGEFLILYWIGRVKRVVVYELLSYPLLLLALISLAEDWTIGYDNYNTTYTPLWNIYFLTSIIVVAVVAAASFVKRKVATETDDSFPQMQPIADAVFKILLAALPFIALQLELTNFWEHLHTKSALEVTANDGYKYTVHNSDINHFKSISVICFSMLYISILSWVNILRLRSKNLAAINFVLNVISIMSFLLVGLYTLSLLRDSYLNPSNDAYYEHGVVNLFTRYIAYLFAAFLLWTSYRYIKQDLFEAKLRKVFDVFFNVALIWIASSELIHWMDLSYSEQSYKLGLSILWGSYALVLTAFGIWRNKQHLRIGAISLFAFTLIKLVLYDIAHLNTISKTIVFVSLGVLLLIVSFLYNKYKSKINAEDEVQTVD